MCCNSFLYFTTTSCQFEYFCHSSFLLFFFIESITSIAFCTVGTTCLALVTCFDEHVTIPPFLDLDQQKLCLFPNACTKLRLQPDMMLLALMQSPLIVCVGDEPIFHPLNSSIHAGGPCTEDATCG